MESSNNNETETEHEHADEIEIQAEQAYQEVLAEQDAQSASTGSIRRMVQAVLRKFGVRPG